MWSTCQTYLAYIGIVASLSWASFVLLFPGKLSKVSPRQRVGPRRRRTLWRSGTVAWGSSSPRASDIISHSPTQHAFEAPARDQIGLRSSGLPGFRICCESEAPGFCLLHAKCMSGSGWRLKRRDRHPGKDMKTKHGDKLHTKWEYLGAASVPCLHC